MTGLFKKIAEFIVFRNVFIAIAAVCLVAESRFLSGGEWLKADALIAFTFFSTFLTYNFHSFSNDSENEFSVPQLFRDFLNPVISIEQRICVGIGMVTTLVTLFFLDIKVILFFIPIGLITMAYSLPLFKIENRRRGLRDIIYVKIVTVALIWALSTTVWPYLNDGQPVSFQFLLLLFAERFLFIYAITLPFEIRDRHREKAIGNKTIPIIYGVGKSKILGYITLALYCLIVTIREIAFAPSSADSMKHFLALFLSAATAALLIYKTDDARSRWFYKFLIDGTIIEQFILLILVQNLAGWI